MTKDIQSSPSTVYSRTLFVWSKDGAVRCFSPDEIGPVGTEAWRAAGGKHTATIDPARFIETMANGRMDCSDMLDELLAT